jgi:hypothetical protein
MQKPTKVESSGTLNLAELSFPYPHHITIFLRESDKFLSWQAVFFLDIFRAPEPYQAGQGISSKLTQKAPPAQVSTK